MNVSCPTEDRIRQRARHWKRRSRNPVTSAGEVLAALFLVSCLACQAADLASWYGEKHRGLRMANGQRFDPDKLTAASWFYNLGTTVVVTHENRSVIVKITDRGPAKRLLGEGIKIDLSRAAFAKLADPDLGLINVTVRKQSWTGPFGR
ncbi:MAG: septal ring lytic transglycosylase RlpA family protein [Verrucomicrobiia bacterium]